MRVQEKTQTTPRVGHWIGKYWLAVIGAILVPLAVFSLAMSPLALGFMDSIGAAIWIGLGAIAAYPLIYIFCTVKTVRLYRAGAEAGWWGHIPIFYFVVLFAAWSFGSI
jgi:hypothetical protein